MPRLASSASLDYPPEKDLDAVSFGLGTVYAPLRPNMVCSLDLEDVVDYVAECYDHAGHVGPMGTATVGGAKLVVSGGTQTISIHTADLEELYCIKTGLAPPMWELSPYTIPRTCW